jgi:hypothetical protein
MLGGFEDAAQEDVLPPEGEEEGSVALVDLASRLGHVVGGSEARGDVRHGRAVSGEGVELRAAGLLDLGVVLSRRAVIAESWHALWNLARFSGSMPAAASRAR